MATRHVAVIGGGPAGLFAARLLARRHPSWAVVLFERLPPLETFGFGVGLSGGTLRSLAAADADVHADVLAEAYEYSSARFMLPSGEVRIPGFHSGVAIGRARMLANLHRRAVEAGVDVRVGTSVALADVAGHADLVIAADGVSSPTRQSLSREFGARVGQGRGLFIWCGSEAPLGGMIFRPVETEHGLFVAHAYPYAPGRSTWVIETDEQSWRRAGFHASQTSAHGTDEQAIEYLSRAFADVLSGKPLIGNKSQWGPFRTVTCERWSHGHLVLLGDAAANAHPSVGSGTKLAMESAIALDEALEEEATITGALAAFETRRRPAVERFQDRARRSHLWWESLGSRLDMTPERLAVAFLTRAGVVSVDALQTTAPELVRAATAQFAGVAEQDLPPSGLPGWVVGRATALRAADTQLPVGCADPWGAEADEIVAKARSLRAAGGVDLELVGADTRPALLDRLALAERIRVETGLRVQVAAPRERLHDIADALVAGRLDAASPVAS
jgi:anthraniloyl-CoA monooxygenase